MAELKFFWDYMTEHVDRIRRVVELLDHFRVRYALIGGHAVSFHARPRLTVDVDFLVAMKQLSTIEKALPEAGFVARRRGDVLRAWDEGMDPDANEPVLDFVPAELGDAQSEALRSAIEVRYQNIELRMVSRPALVALKFLSATSFTRAIWTRCKTWWTSVTRSRSPSRTPTLPKPGGSSRHRIPRRRTSCPV